MMSPNDPTRSASAPVAQDGAPLCLSLSEINALCFKAARGAGLTWGEAEEAGWAAAWLTRAGLAGPVILLNWLRDCATLARPVPEVGCWRAQSGPLCPLRAGLALADHAGLPEGPGTTTLTITSVAHPLILLPFVARAAKRLDQPLQIGWGGVEITLDGLQNGPIRVLPEEQDTGPADLRITAVASPQDTETQADSAAPAQALALSDWQALDALALRVTVPPSAASRAGAGAAGDDND